MKKRLLLLVLAGAAAISGCVTTAGYRGHGGYYGASSDDRYSRSYPYGYYGGDQYYYGYDRYGRPYATYGYGSPYGGGSYGYGYPYGYNDPYYGNRYYYYYPPHYRPPVTGTNNPPPPPPLRPDRPHRDLSRYRRPQTPIVEQPDGLSRDLSRYRRAQQAVPAPDYEEMRPENIQHMRPMREQMQPRMQPSAPSPSVESVIRAAPTSAGDTLDDIRARKADPGR